MKACIFDLDGTLANTLESMACAANGILEELGLRSLPVDNYRYYCGEGASMLVRRCLRDAGDAELGHFEEMDRIYRERFQANPLYRVSVYPGIREMLQSLKEKGALLAVCSNKPHDAAVRVIRELFGDMFDEVIGQSGELRRKPYPDAPLLLAEKLGVEPRECLYIGDSGTDMQTGHAAGMKTVGAVWGFRGREELTENHADYLVEKPEEILQVYEQKIRVIFSDLDGTLLHNDAMELEEHVFTMVRRLQEKGILFAAASGRQYANMRRMLSPVAEDIVFVCENGALAVYKDETLYQEAFPADLSRDIFERAIRKKGSEFMYSGAAHHFLFPKSPEFENYMKNVVRDDLICVTEYHEITEECVKCAVYEPEGTPEENLAYWHEIFGDRCEVVTSGNRWIDFIPFGINKGLGIVRVCEKFGISRAMSMAFGDDRNDIDMLKNAGFGVAMSHARPALLEIARFSADWEEDVAEALIRSNGILNEEVLQCIQKKQ